MQNFKNRKILVALVAVCATCYIFNSYFRIDDSVFNLFPTQEERYSWDEYVRDREKRNVIKMQKSFEELMALGRAYSNQGEWSLANENFFYAKSLYPERIEPRRQLCYSFLMSCKYDYRYCTKAKKEIYYAMRYVEPTDHVNREYLTELVDLVDIGDIVNLEEVEALPLIF